MAKKPQEAPSTVRLQSIVDLDTAARMDEARAALKRAGIHVSSSMLVEIALRELLGRRDLLRVMREYKERAGTDASLARRPNREQH